MLSALTRAEGGQIPHPSFQKGETGSSGPQGFKGEKGEKGVSGPPGMMGPAGNRGPRGNDGVPGHSGIKGERGNTGPMGPPGATPVIEVEGGGRRRFHQVKIRHRPVRPVQLNQLTI